MSVLYRMSARHRACEEFVCNTGRRAIYCQPLPILSHRLPMIPPQAILLRRALRYIETPKGREQFEDAFGTTLAVHIITSLIALVIGLLMVLSIYYALGGFSVIWSALTLETMRN